MSLPVKFQVFLQQLLKTHYIPISQALEILKAINEQIVEEDETQAWSNDINEELLRNVIRSINTQIRKHSLSISIANCEVTDQQFVSLINTMDESLKKLQYEYQSIELVYWSHLMDEIIKSEGRSLERLSCLNLATKYNIKMKMIDVEDLLAKYVKKGYIVEKDGRYYLGGRCLVEFYTLLVTNFKDYIHKCELCSELCCYGNTCLNCNKQMHVNCLLKVWKTRKVCPLCNVAWGNYDFEQPNASFVQPLAQSSMIVDSNLQPVARKSSRRR